MTEEEVEDEGDQHHADDEVLDDRVRRQLHEIAAVVVRLKIHPRREDVVLADVVDAIVNALEGARRLAAVAHQNDALHDVRLAVAADETETRREADVGVGDVLHADGDAVLLGDDDVFDVVRVAEEADAADGVRLLADVEALAADVLIGRLDGRDERLERLPLAAEAIRIDADVELFALAAEADDVDDPFDLLELPLEHPVFGRLQLTERVAGADDAVAKDFADRVPRRERRLHPRGEVAHELEAVDDLLPRVVVFGRPVEIALHVGQLEERLRARVLQAGHAGQADFERDRDVPLDLFGAPPVGLRDDVDHRRHRVRVRLDVEVAVREDAGEDEHGRSRKDDERHPQSECDESLDHRGFPLVARERPARAVTAPRARGP